MKLEHRELIGENECRIGVFTESFDPTLCITGVEYCMQAKETHRYNPRWATGKIRIVEVTTQKRFSAADFQTVSVSHWRIYVRILNGKARQTN